MFPTEHLRRRRPARFSLYLGGIRRRFFTARSSRPWSGFCLCVPGNSCHRADIFVFKTPHTFLDFYIDIATGGADTSKDGSDLAAGWCLAQGLPAQTDDVGFIRSQAFQGMMASQETTSFLLGNIFLLLSRNPTSWQRVGSEVLDKGGTILNFDALLDSKVLQNVLLEPLRLYPVFPLMGRVALRDTILPVGGGPDDTAPVFVPKGTKVEMGFHVLHRNPRVYGDGVEDFGPERWNSISPNNGNTWGLVEAVGRASGARRASLRQRMYWLGWRYDLRSWRVEMIQSGGAR
ncbi:cytochrome P450 [Biscogniauxia marginata]|nr:cytochrome P450 [Biscogniauxia marginata]